MEMKLTLHATLEVNARRYPDREAVIFEGTRLTYAELNERVNRLANGLLGAGLKPGDHCALLFANCVEFLESMLALSKIGVTFVCLNTLLTPRELQYIIQHSDARGLIVEHEFVDKIVKVRDELTGLDPDLVFCVNGDAAGFRPFHEALSGDPSEPEIEVSETDRMRLAYTSGTTGLPKGVIHSHRMQTLMFYQFGVELGLGQERMMIVGPMYAIGPFVFGLMSVYFGGTLILLRKFDAHKVLRVITDEKVTASFMVPTMYNLVLAISEDERLATYDVGSVRILSSGSAPRHKATRESMFGYFSSARINEGYGSTEGGLNTNLGHDEQIRKIDTVGRAVVGCEIKVVDDDGVEVAPDDVGELWVRSLSLASGYYKNEEATAENFAGGWFRTGDLVTMDQEGFVSLVDRKTDVIISGGVNVYPTEVEQVLYEHPAVLEAVVIGVPDEKWGEAVKAVVSLRKGEHFDGGELLEWMRDRVAGYKRPKSIDIREDLPKNAAGKVLRRVLRDKYWEGRDRKI